MSRVRVEAFTHIAMVEHPHRSVEVLDWCKATYGRAAFNGGQNVHRWNAKTSMRWYPVFTSRLRIRFRHEQDIVLFHLRWG